MKQILATLFSLFFLCNLSAQHEIITIDTQQYVVSYTPLPEAIAATEKALAATDRQIAKVQTEIEQSIAQLKNLQTRKVELETGLKLMQNPAPSKSVSSKSADPAPTPPTPTKTAKKKKKKPDTPAPKPEKPPRKKRPGPFKDE